MSFLFLVLLSRDEDFPKWFAFPAFFACICMACLRYPDPEAAREQQEHSQRVKAVDFHASWVLTAVYSGHVAIWDTNTLFNDNDSNNNKITADDDDDDDDIESNTIEKETKPFAVIPVGDKRPVRCAKFVERYHSIVTASDDGIIRVYHLHSYKLMQEFEAHDDYIRHLEVHPTLPYLLSASDDMKVICWDMEYNFARRRVYEDHYHYVMQVKIHPKDTTMFASASLDRTIKVWNLEQEDASSPLYTLQDGHNRGINCLEWCQTPDNNNNGKQSYYLISGSDDRTVKVWDLATKAVIHSLEGHSHNVTAVLCHPTLPLLITAAEDGECRVWNATTYEEVSSFDHANWGRAWTLAAVPGKNTLAIGFDQGCLCVNLQSDDTDFRRGLEVTHPRILTIGDP
jgi:coatomer subunit beta'